MSDFLLHLNENEGSRNLVSLMRMPYAHRRPEGKQFQFPWGSLAVLQERFGQNVFQVNGTVMGWVGDPMISEGLVQALADYAAQSRREAGTVASPVLPGSVLDQLNGSFAFVIADAQ